MFNYPVLKHSPDLANFSNLVISQIPTKWKLFGTLLGFSKHDMDVIELDSQVADRSKWCFISLFEEWRKRRGSHNMRDFTWRTVVMILSKTLLSEFELANRVYTFCVRRFPSTDMDQHSEIVIP